MGGLPAGYAGLMGGADGPRLGSERAAGDTASRGDRSDSYEGNIAGLVGEPALLNPACTRTPAAHSQPFQVGDSPRYASAASPTFASSVFPAFEARLVVHALAVLPPLSPQALRPRLLAPLPPTARTQSRSHAAQRACGRRARVPADATRLERRDAPPNRAQPTRPRGLGR